MPELPADVIRRAEADMRKYAQAAINAGWERPTIIDFAEEGGLCIGAGHAASTPGAPTVPAQYVADVELPEFAEHIASASPQIMLLVADLLDAAAADFDMVERINSRDPDNDGATRVMCHPVSSAALKLARACLGENDA